MDFKRMMIACSLSLLILIGWESLFPTPKPQAQNTPAATQTAPTSAQVSGSLNSTSPITVTTDTVKAIIDEKSGDLRELTLLQYNATEDESKEFVLLQTSPEHTYIAQSNLVDANGNNILQNVSFQAAEKNHTLNGDKLEVRLSAEHNGLKIDKIYTFTKGSYLFNVRFDVQNASGQAVKLGTHYNVVRDNHTPAGQGWFMHSYTGPVVYTPDADEFQKVAFGDLDDDFKKGKDTAEYQRKATGGYVGMIQHYFMTTWLMQTHDAQSNICTNGCTVDVKRRADNLYGAGINIATTDIAAGSQHSFAANLYAGPQITKVLNSIAPDLALSKDYGRVHIFAAPLFWLLNLIHNFVGNWGWAIVLLTIIVKAVLYPLNDKAYKSMAKMRTVAPKMEAIKKKYGEDRMGMQQAMMKLYQDEKINPLGGCLPMLLQMPIFIGLYWMIFLSVELRQAPWLGWITDLSRPDPIFILPILMAATMWFQTTLNPPPSDPMQAQMMKIMPLMFSIMFFFFPSGLVLYYVVNNLLTIAQQWYINKQSAQTAQQPKVEILDKEPKNKK
ncbi:membrane protein insertase YidC [Alysiella filiformis]|uniref:Membrane protein insertase YidC n=1 Tax=Alysiella filiformis DSM 16848 TaxID=1120981 RepID=A0A286EBW0_9NEIS|nr:membrane protein insertase YidC [Alysiella filiformis]QMT31329.1 membrane protein insertase YidC [Alysiella filiformis]UBQ55665.1 membrane protein insertase YidC [Alysiella filiformis DSM 16848]SOD68366.1 YidC/Oxa1 family membrane protein insertase [Alysiella filiformis DSM 16848]